jgi:hypothetical protein
LAGAFATTFGAGLAADLVADLAAGFFAGAVAALPGDFLLCGLVAMDWVGLDKKGGRC